MATVITSLPDTGRTHHRRFVWYLFSLFTTKRQKPRRDKHWQKRSKWTASPACVRAIQNLTYDMCRRALKQPDVLQNVRWCVSRSCGLSLTWRCGSAASCTAGWVYSAWKFELRHATATYLRPSVVPLLQKFSALYGNLTFISVFTKAVHWSIYLKMLIWYLISNDGLKIHPNISLPSPDRYCRSPDQNPVCISQPSHAYYMPLPYGPPSRCSYGLRSYGTLRGVRR